MIGYKYAIRIDENGTDIDDHYGIFVRTEPVLIVLDIPDDAMTSTPKERYSDFSKADKKEYENYYRYAATDLPTLLSEYMTLLDQVYYFSFDNPDEIRRLSYSQKREDIDNFVHASKCRCSITKVVDIIGMYSGEHYPSAVSDYDNAFEYIVGSTVIPATWELNIFSICGGGIHYFKYPILAVLYKLPAHSKAARYVMGSLSDDFKNRYMTEKLNKLDFEEG